MNTDEQEAAIPPPPSLPDDEDVAGSSDASGPTASTSSSEPGSADAGLVRSGGVVAIGTLLSRATGLLRTIVLVAVLGAQGRGAAYNAANNTPNMIYDLLLGGILSATLVPALVGNRERDDKDGTAAVLTVCTVVLLVVTVVGIIAAPLIVGGYAALADTTKDPLSPDQQALATAWLRMFAPQVLFYGLTTLGSAYLNANRRFAAAALAPVVNNVWMIALLLAMAKSLQGHSAGSLLNDATLVALLGFGTTAGIVAMALVLLPAIQRAGLPLRWHFDLHSPAVRQVARLSGWTLGYVLANQITMFVIIGLAGNGVTFWNAAYQFYQVPYGVFTVSIMTAFTPELSSLAGRHAMDEYRARFLQGFRLVVITVLPATVAFVLLAQPLVIALLKHGDFEASSVAPTASTLVALAWGLVGFAVYLYVLRAFYTFRDTRTPFIINVVENAITVVLAVVLATESGLGWGVEGLAWAWSLAYLVSAVGAFVVLRVRLGSFGFETTVATTATIIRMLTASAVMAACVFAVVTLLPETTSAWTELIVGSVLGLAVYGGALLLLGVSEARYLPRMLLRR